MRFYKGGISPEWSDCEECLKPTSIRSPVYFLSPKHGAGMQICVRCLARMVVKVERKFGVGLFGFTREDVRVLEYKGVGYDEGHDDDALDKLAAKIAALLPPE